MKFVIESDGVLRGVFETDRQAAEWALDNCAAPWRLRELHVIPPRRAEEGAQ